MIRRSNLISSFRRLSFNFSHIGLSSEISFIIRPLQQLHIRFNVVQTEKKCYMFYWLKGIILIVKLMTVFICFKNFVSHILRLGVFLWHRKALLRWFSEWWRRRYNNISKENEGPWQGYEGFKITFLWRIFNKGINILIL